MGFPSFKMPKISTPNLGAGTTEEFYGSLPKELGFQKEIGSTGLTVADISDPSVMYNSQMRKGKEESEKRKAARVAAAKAEAERPKTKGQEGVIDYTKLQKTLKQMQGVKGKAINPDILKSLLSGAVEGQVKTAAATEERAMDRSIQQERTAIQAEQHKQALKVEERAAEAGFVGDVLGVVGEITVLCTELNRQGLLDIQVIERANKYRGENISKEVYEGYLMWATPLVAVMKDSPVATKIVCSLWKPLTYELASRGNRRKGNLIGKISYGILSQFSKVVYFCNQKEGIRWVAQ